MHWIFYKYFSLLILGSWILNKDPSEAAEGGTQGKLVEALRQVRINHRGNYRHLLEHMLISYRVAKMQGEDCSNAESAAASTSDSPERSSDQVTDSKAECLRQLAEVQNASEDSEMRDEQYDKKM